MKRSNKYLKIIITVFCALLFSSQQKALGQRTSSFLIIDITKIDTLPLEDVQYKEDFPSSLVQVVRFKIVKTAGKIKYKAATMIVTPLVFSDHICLYDFKVGKRYKLPVIQTKFTSALVRKELRPWHYQTNCRNMPEEQL